MKKILVAIILLGLTAVIAYTVSNENLLRFHDKLGIRGRKQKT